MKNKQREQVEVTCICGNKRHLWTGVQNPACSICRCDMEIAANVRSGAIESVTQWKDCKRIKRNIERWKRKYWPKDEFYRYCLWCGVTLAGKRIHTKTCSGKCRKALSRTGVKDHLIVAMRWNRYGTE